MTTEAPRTRLLAFIEKVTEGQSVEEAIGLEQDQFVSDIESLLWEERAATAERERAERLEAALRTIVDQAGTRYDDQWATGPVLLVDLDAARAALTGGPSGE